MTRLLCAFLGHIWTTGYEAGESWHECQRCRESIVCDFLWKRLRWERICATRSERP